MQYYHTTITRDDRCLDLLLTEDEVSTFFARSLETKNQPYIPLQKRCSCWPSQKPPQCHFWKRILGLCLECDCSKTKT
jgi:hypothetical protein